MTLSRVTGRDYLAAYAAIRTRIAAIVPAHCDDPVPACPGWRVHDVVAHLTGLCEDWVDGHLEAYASDTWTADHVSRHAMLTCEELLDRWAEAMGPFAALADQDAETPPSRFAFGDAVIHEADIREAVDADRVPADAVLLGLHGTMARWEHEVLAPAGLLTLHLRTTEGPEWWLGTPDDPDALVVEAPVDEVFRALAGRRFEEQVRDWDWSADPEAVIEAGLPFPFRWRAASLDE
jgi:uncharacterized protein (TIGR03083 family)